MIIQIIILVVVLIMTIILVDNELRRQKNRDYNEEMFHLLAVKVEKVIAKLKGRSTDYTIDTKRKLTNYEKEMLH